MVSNAEHCPYEAQKKSNETMGAEQRRTRRVRRRRRRRFTIQVKHHQPFVSS
jgi:hypothetical protein